MGPNEVTSQEPRAWNLYINIYHVFYIYYKLISILYKYIYIYSNMFFSLNCCCCSIAWKETCCCSRSDILFLARRARAPLWRVPHAVIGETKEIHPRKAQVCAKTFLNTVPVLWRSMCHPTFQYIFFHFSIQACHRIWNLWIEPLNQGSNTESMVGSLRGTLQGTLFHSQPFAQVSNPTSMLTEQLRKFRNCSVSMDVKARPGSASMTPTIKGAKGRMPKTIARTTQPTQRTTRSNCMIIWAPSKRQDGCILLWLAVLCSTRVRRLLTLVEHIAFAPLPQLAHQNSGDQHKGRRSHPNQYFIFDIKSPMETREIGSVDHHIYHTNGYQKPS